MLFFWVCCEYLLALAFSKLGQVGTIVELALEELYSNDSEDEIEEHVNDENVKDVLERIDHTVKDRFELGHPIDCLQWSQHTQHSQRLDRVQVFACTVTLTYYSENQSN